MRFFFLLEGGSRVDIGSDELEIAAKEFVDRMMDTCDKERDYAVLARTLNYTRIRLQILYEIYQAGYEAEKKHGVSGMYSCGFIAD